MKLIRAQYDEYSIDKPPLPALRGPEVIEEESDDGGEDDGAGGGKERTPERRLRPRKRTLPMTGEPSRKTAKSQTEISKIDTILRIVERTADVVDKEMRQMREKLAGCREKMGMMERELNENKRTSEKCLTLLQDCLTRLGVAEARITDLQKERQDRAIQSISAVTAFTSTPPLQQTTPHLVVAPKPGGSGGMGLF